MFERVASFLEGSFLVFSQNVLGLGSYGEKRHG